MDRRKFISQSGLGLAAISISEPGFLGLKSSGIAPSDQLNIGVIGCRGRGFRVLKQHLDLGGINCLALCDVDSRVLAEKKEILKKEYDQNPATYKDFRKMLESKELDAVIIGSPDHWHCLHTLFALQAGKDVYVEKPMANSIAECDLMVRAAKRYNRVVQVGQQQRSGKVWNEIMGIMKSGRIGHISKTNIWANFNYGLGPQRQKNGPVPQGVDYNMYLGPATSRPFNPNRFHGGWRHFWDYGGGLMTDFGAHLIDMALWVRDINSPPKTVLAYGSKSDNPELAKETFDTMSVIFPLDDYSIQWESNAGKQVGPYGRLYGLEFLGEKASLVVDRSGYEIIPEWDNSKKIHKTEEYKSPKFNSGHNFHIQDFVKAVKERTKVACPPEVGKIVAMYAHMANIAARSGEYRLDWNDSRKKFDQKKANSFITPEYRKPWELPRI